MRPISVIVAASAVFLAGCGYFRGSKGTIEPIAVVLPTPAADKLADIKDAEILQDAAILTAVRPHLTDVKAPALHLYDSVVFGLVSIGGEPSAKDVARFSALIGMPDQAALDKLRSEKVALAKSADEWKAKAEAERNERVKAEAKAAAEGQRRREMAEQAMDAKSAMWLGIVGASAVAFGLIGIFLGDKFGVGKVNAGLTCAAGVLVAVSAPRLVVLFGRDQTQYLMLGLLAFFFIDAAIFVSVRTYRKLYPTPTPEPKPDAPTPVA